MAWNLRTVAIGAVPDISQSFIISLKRLSALLLGVVLLLACYVYLASIDSQSFDDFGLLNYKVKEHAEDNGFTELAFTEEKDYSILAYEQRQKMRKVVAVKILDKDYAVEFTDQYQWEISRFVSASGYGYFHYPHADDVNDLPQFQVMIDLSLLTLLKSRLEADRGNIDDAIVLANAALVMSNRIMGANGYLISYMIGLVLQHDALRWTQQLAFHYPLDLTQIDKLNLSVQAMPSYLQDDFRSVLAAEFEFSKNMFISISTKPLSERWQTYRDGEDYWNADLDGDLEFGRENTKQKIYAFVSALLPQFYSHKNRQLTMMAKYYLALAEESNHYCNEMPEATDPYIEKPLTWLNVFLPNIGRRDLDQAAGTFTHYLYRRCLAHAQLEAAKTILAIRSYEQRHQRKIASLKELVPVYLPRIPVDPFDGRELRFSPQNQWLYSVGNNFDDDGGSEQGCYYHHCFRDENCFKNPTFPLNPEICYSVVEAHLNSD